MTRNKKVFVEDLAIIFICQLAVHVYTNLNGTDLQACKGKGESRLLINTINKLIVSETNLYVNQILFS